MITIGTDIVDVARIEEKLDALLARVLLPAEREYCLKQAYPPQHVAGRFAAKEAVFKALRAPTPNGITWHDIRIENEPGGTPVAQLSGAAAALADERGLRHVYLSIAHVREFATATAVCEWADARNAVPKAPGGVV
jgi:holo-[acyl-carrier protein] synthase